MKLSPHKHNPSDRDPRGLLLIWEPPKEGATYVIGADPAEGIVGWSRYNRKKDDSKNDNCVAEIVRRGGHGEPDVQVAEYAAPIDCQDFASVLSYLGLIYRGREEQAHIICEAQGGGLLTIRTLMDSLNYWNLYRWQTLDGSTPRMTNSVGWWATQRSVPVLWAKGARYITKGQILLNSPHLVEELKYCQYDPIRKRGEAIPGKHDDRVRAIMLAGWAARDWSTQFEEPGLEGNGSKPIEPHPGHTSYATIAVTPDFDIDPNEDWERRFYDALD